MRHEDVWRALDTLAAEKGLSPSGLARAAGLDPTAFNRSKRTSPNGLRWPSTESLSRVLSATGASLESFTALVGGARALTGGGRERARYLPLLPLSRLGEVELFDALGHPAGHGWEQTEVPQPGDPHSYAVRLDDPRFEPVFREGGILILSPDSPIRPGDRMLVRADGGINAFVAGTPCRPLDRRGGELAERPDWSHRIVWTSL